MNLGVSPRRQGISLSAALAEARVAALTEARAVVAAGAPDAVDDPVAIFAVSDWTTDALRGLLERSAWCRVDDTARQPRAGDVLLMNSEQGPLLGLVVVADGATWFFRALGGFEDGRGAVDPIRFRGLDELGALGFGCFELWGHGG